MLIFGFVATPTSPVSRRAARGARFLDRREPGWADHIRLDALDIRDSRACVLGQLYGSYGVGARCYDRAFRGRVLHWPARYGFAAVFFNAALTRAWKREILKRRGAWQKIPGASSIFVRTIKAF